MHSKADIRRQMRTRLRELNVEERKNRSVQLCEALAREPGFARAETIAIFDPLPSEPDVSLLWQMAPRRFLYPRIVEDQLQLLFADSMEDLVHTDPKMPFREPPYAPERVASWSEVDLILVPGLAFSRDGRRLGRGGGYYDRLLSTLVPKTAKIGVCFDFQVLTEIPMEPHDERVNAVVAM